MVIGGVTNEMLSLAMQATALRDRVYSHNIANNDTPRYKKYELHFEEQLKKIRNDYNKTGTLDKSRFTPEIRRIHTNLSVRMDGNNVDINEENTLLYRNAAIYDALVNSYMANRQLDTFVFNSLR